MGLTLEEAINYLDALYWGEHNDNPICAENILSAKVVLERALAIKQEEK